MRTFFPLRDEDPREVGVRPWELIGRLSDNPDKSIFLGKNGSSHVAIKILRTEIETDDRQWELFGREVSILQELDHPNIPELIDFDFSDTNLPWIATKFIEGVTLEEVVLTKNKIPEHEWFAILKTCSEILSFLHSKGIVHRDISPGNIIINNSQPFLIDYGLSQFIADESIDEVVGGGTKPFVSPEHLKEVIDPSMDIFSLGSTLVFAGSGHYSFTKKGPTHDSNFENELVAEDWARQILYLSPNFEGLSNAQTKILKPMLFKDPRDRIKADELLKSLNNFDTKTSSDFEIDYSILKNYLKSSSKKLRKLDPLLGKKRRIRQSVIAGFTALVLVVLYITGTLSEVQDAYKERKISTCLKYLRLGDLDSAILQCLQDSTQGDREADPYLALAYLGKKLDDEAARVIDDCKDLNLICRSLFFRTPKNFDASVRELEKAYNSGFGPASYFLSRIYRERNDKAKAEFWALEGHRAGVGISSLFYSLILTDSMKYQEALDILKQTKITREDLIWNPIVLKYNNVIERLSISLFFRMNQDDQVQEFLLDCANKGNPYCMGEAALQYSKQEDWSNALKWAQKGAVAGDGGSMYVLSRYYRDLNGRSAQEMNTNQFEEKISQWMMASAEAGYLPALKQVWFFYLIPSISNRGDLTFSETAKLACYWYMKLLIAIEDEKTDPFAGAGYVSDVDFNLDDSSGRKLMDWLNCTTRFQ